MRRSLRRSTRLEHDEEIARPLRSTRRSTRLSSPRSFEEDDISQDHKRRRKSVSRRHVKSEDEEEEKEEEEDDEEEDQTAGDADTTTAVADQEERNEKMVPEEEPQEDEDEEEEVEEEEEEEEVEEIPMPRRRGRPPKRKRAVLALTSRNRIPRKLKRSSRQPGSDEEEDREQEEAEDGEGGNVSQDQTRKRRKPGRKPGFKKRINSPFPKYTDNDGNEVKLNDDQDEYIIANDPEGEKKIDSLGNLKGGRDFRVRTFTVMNKGDKLYMLSTEPARCLGYRDAYYLFLKHPTLFKFILSYEEKQDLVDRKIIPNSYKSRTIGLVTARSIFKEFGAQIIIGGRKVIDDYYETKAREDGEVEGEIAVPEDPVPMNKNEYNKKRYIAWYGGSQIYQQSIASQLITSTNEGSGSGSSNNIRVSSVRKFVGFPMHKPFSVKSNASENAINDENWMHEHILATNSLNRELAKTRLDTLSKRKRAKDPYTGIYFYPQITQASRAVWYKNVKSTSSSSRKETCLPSINHSNWGGLNGDIKNHSDGLIYQTILESGSLIKNTGLKNVDVKIFDDCVSLDVKNAILEQQLIENL